MKEISLTLPRPPSVNHLYVQICSNCRNSRIMKFVGAKGKEWFEEAGWIVKSKFRGQAIQEPVAVSVKLFHARRVDYDNCLKALNDLLQQTGILEDDSLVVQAEVEKIKVAHVKDEKVEITIKNASKKG